MRQSINKNSHRILSSPARALSGHRQHAGNAYHRHFPPLSLSLLPSRRILFKPTDDINPGTLIYAARFAVIYVIKIQLSAIFMEFACPRVRNAP